MANNRFKKLKEYANRRQAEIMDNARYVMDMEITTDFNDVMDATPTITYKITEIILPSDFEEFDYDK